MAHSSSDLDIKQLSVAERLDLIACFGTASQIRSTSCLSRNGIAMNWNVGWLTLTLIPMRQFLGRKSKSV